MVSLRIIEIQKQPKLTKTKAAALAILVSCAFLYKGSRGGGNSILQNIDNDLLFIIVAVLAGISAVIFLVCFTIEQSKQQIQIGNAIFSETSVQQTYKHGALISSYTDISRIYVRQEYSINSSSLFLIQLYSNEGAGYCFDDFICEISSWGTARYLADYLRQQGVNCELSEQNVQAEVAAEKVRRWL